MNTARGFEGGSDNAPFARQSVRSPSSPERTAPLWLAAAFFAAALAPGAQARDLAGASRSGDTSLRLAQAQTTNPAELQAGPEQEQSRAEMLTRELTAARRDVMFLLTLLKQEREHAALLEQDLAAARQDVETQKAPVVKPPTEVSQLKKRADAGSAELRKTLQQERDRATRLEQDLASARRDVETQMAFAAKASDEVTKFKQAAEKGSAELRQSLQKEQEKAETLAQELAMARARIYAFEAQARQASDQAAELKQTAEGGVADLRTSLQQERDRASRLEQDVAAARRDVEKQSALAAKAGEEARQMKQAADSAAELQKSLEQEQERTAHLEQDVAAARRDLEKQTALAAKAEVRQSNQAAGSAAELQKPPEQQERAAGLEQDVAAARRDVEKQTARAAKASRHASRTKRTAANSTAWWFNSNSIWKLIFAPPRR
jgi:DNA repair exonuclease SbcCD ATPase subunit